jgi:hypothetical protein
LRSILITS